MEQKSNCEFGRASEIKHYHTQIFLGFLPILQHGRKGKDMGFLLTQHHLPKPLLMEPKSLYRVCSYDDLCILVKTQNDEGSIYEKVQEG